MLLLSGLRDKDRGLVRRSKTRNQWGRSCCIGGALILRIDLITLLWRSLLRDKERSLSIVLGLSLARLVVCLLLLMKVGSVLVMIGSSCLILVAIISLIELLRVEMRGWHGLGMKITLMSERSGKKVIRVRILIIILVIIVSLRRILAILWISCPSLLKISIIKESIPGLLLKLRGLNIHSVVQKLIKILIFSFIFIFLST